MSTNNSNEDIKNTYQLPSGLTIQQVEDQSKLTVEEIYINAFAAGHPRFYVDERCGEEQMVRANADGSEDLVHFDWQSRKDTFIRSLESVSKGKYAYLLNDARFIALNKKE